MTRPHKPKHHTYSTMEQHWYFKARYKMGEQIYQNRRSLGVGAIHPDSTEDINYLGRHRPHEHEVSLEETPISSPGRSGKEVALNRVGWRATYGASNGEDQGGDRLC